MADTVPSLLLRKKVLGGTEETTSGTFPTVSTALGSTHVYDPKMIPQGIVDNGKRMPAGNYLGNYNAFATQRLGQLTFRQELRHGDKFVEMLTGAGFKLATGTYAPTSDMSSRKTWGFKLWEDGRLKALAGAAADFTISLVNGQIAFCDWTWSGVWVQPTDTTLVSQAITNTSPYLVKSMTLTVGGAEVAHISTLTIAMNNTVEMREDVTSAAAFIHGIVTERAPTLTADHEARLVATRDVFGLLLAGTTAAISVVLTDGSNTLTIAVPVAQIINVGDDARGGRLVDTITYQANASSGDDEITFTES